MQFQSQNLTIQSSQVLATCIDLVSLLVNKTSGSRSNVTFKTASGYDFIHIGGQKHFPILVDEHLFKFLHILWAAATVFACVFVSVGVLACLNHFCLWFCKVPDYWLDDRCGESPATGGTESPIRLVEFDHIRADKPFVRSFTKRAIASHDNHLLIRSFNCDQSIAGEGHYLQLTPKIHCNFLNCPPDQCHQQHISYVYIPCHCSHTNQIKFIRPEETQPVDHKRVLISHLKAMEV
jgi:hypothetical protein